MPKAKKVKSGAAKKILIIEDDTLFGDIYREQFTQAGFDVIIALNGEVGLAKAKSEMPDVILLDLVLSHMTGFQVLQGIEADPQTKKIPVFVVTNLGQESDMARAKQLGARGFFVKSNTLFSTVLAKVRETVGS